MAEKKKPRCLVLSGFGLNAESELAYAFSLGGAEASIAHFSSISSGAVKLSDYQIFAIPGGWSYADEISSGRVLANKLKSTFRSQFEAFAASGKPVIGICNGFQTLVKLGALPNISGSFSQESTLASNASGKFENRWVYLKPQKTVCRYFEGVPFIHCPVRHGEGRFMAKDEETLLLLQRKGLVALKYADEKLSEAAGYPQNPNGAAGNIAGICNEGGNVLGLMPHPECSVKRITFPRFTSGISYEKNSIRFFQNIVKAAEKHV
jgi:phosphoribosylformylglycinamidine synthase